MLGRDSITEDMITVNGEKFDSIELEIDNEELFLVLELEEEIDVDDI